MERHSQRRSPTVAAYLHAATGRAREVLPSSDGAGSLPGGEARLRGDLPSRAAHMCAVFLSREHFLALAPRQHAVRFCVFFPPAGGVRQGLLRGGGSAEVVFFYAAAAWLAVPAEAASFVTDCSSGTKETQTGEDTGTMHSRSGTINTGRLQTFDPFCQGIPANHD